MKTLEVRRNTFIEGRAYIRGDRISVREDLAVTLLKTGVALDPEDPEKRDANKRHFEVADADR